MKPRTKQELAQLTKMNPGAFIDEIYVYQWSEVKRKPLFERFYDHMSNLINGNKSIAPAELKSFR